jgi:hypothetical protein
MEIDEVAALLDQIAHDPAFRAWVESDPVAALASRSITINASEVPPGGVCLPPDADILAHLVTLSEEVMGGCATHVHVMLQLGV